MFKVMMQVVSILRGVGALEIMERGNGFEFTGEAWKVYEKKLAGIIAKDPATKGRNAEGGGGKKRRLGNEDEDEEDGDGRSMTSLSPEPEIEPEAVSTPKRKAVRREKTAEMSFVPDEEEGEGEGEEEGMEVDLQFEEEMNAEGEEVRGNGEEGGDDEEEEEDTWGLALPTSQDQRNRSPSVERPIPRKRR
jgi:hypothetical protein